MTRVVAIFLLLITALHGRANDTLTRAQVYNFNVGDTFDYRNSYTNSYNGPDTIYSNTTATYSRYVIASIYYSLDSSTKFIRREEIFPNPNVYDTTVLPNVYNYEVFLDTVCFSVYGVLEVYPVSEFNGSAINILKQNNCSYFQNEYVFAYGLGIALKVNSLQVHFNSTRDSTLLIYHASVTEKWGTPYYNLPTSVEQLTEPLTPLTLFPTVNNGTFNVKIKDENTLPFTFVVNDLTGREITALTLNSTDSDIRLVSCSQGLYIWKAFTGRKFVQTGKIVVK